MAEDPQVGVHDGKVGDHLADAEHNADDDGADDCEDKADRACGCKSTVDAEEDPGANGEAKRYEDEMGVKLLLKVFIWAASGFEVVYRSHVGVPDAVDH